MNILIRIASFMAASYSRWFGTAHVDTSTNEMFVRGLVKDINKTCRSIKIVDAEENVGLYNDRRVVVALKNAFDRGVKIQFVVKPALDEIGDEMKARDP